MKKTITLAAIALSAIVPASASAHAATISADCNQVSFRFTSFPAGPSLVNWTITTASGRALAGTFNVTGSTSFQGVIFQTFGNDTITARATWTADTGGSATATVPVSCPAASPSPVTPPVPAATPIPAPVPTATPTRRTRVKPKAKNCRHGSRRVRRVTRRNGHRVVRFVRVCRHRALPPRFTG